MSSKLICSCCARRFVLNAMAGSEVGEEEMETEFEVIDELAVEDSSDSTQGDSEEITHHVLHLGENEVHVQGLDPGQLMHQAELDNDVKVLTRLLVCVNDELLCGPQLPDSSFLSSPLPLTSFTTR